MLADASPDVVVCEQALPCVLHVEDDAAIARCIATALRRAGFEVVSVPSAEAAIAELAARAFDAIVSDFNLAGTGTGADVLLAAGVTPFLFLTSDDRAGRFNVPWIEKPAAISKVRDAVDLLVARRAA